MSTIDKTPDGIEEKFTVWSIAVHSPVLEHEWVNIFEAENAYDIEELGIAVGISSYNTVKIVPLRYFDDVIKKLES